MFHHLSFIAEIATSSEHAQLSSEANLVMEPISVQDSLGDKPEVKPQECLETTEESKMEEDATTEECKSNEPDIENIGEEAKIASGVELKSNEPGIVSIVEEKEMTDLMKCSTSGEEATDQVNDGSGEMESVTPPPTEHDAKEVAADLSTPLRETCAQPTKLFSSEKSDEPCVESSEVLSAHEEKVEAVKNNLPDEVIEESKQNELTESNMVAQASEQYTSLGENTGTESNSGTTEEGRSDKEQFCDCLRSLKDLASPEVLRELSSEEIFEAHHNLSQITTVVVQALRGRWQSPRSKN